MTAPYVPTYESKKETYDSYNKMYINPAENLYEPSFKSQQYGDIYNELPSYTYFERPLESY
jgi:hypothetical protein